MEDHPITLPPLILLLNPSTKLMEDYRLIKMTNER